jgi:hypothetical protein
MKRNFSAKLDLEKEENSRPLKRDDDENHTRKLEEISR